MTWNWDDRLNARVAELHEQVDTILLGLLDELHLFINPAALGAGLSIFREPGRAFPLKLAGSEAYDCGIVVNSYNRK